MKRWNAFLDVIDAPFVACFCLLVILVTAFIVMPGCATSSRNKALGADVAVLDTANAAVDAYEHKHTQDLITNEKGAQLELDVTAWRAKVDKVRADIDGGYKLAAAAGVANDAPSLKTFEDFLASLHTELVTIGVVPK